MALHRPAVEQGNSSSGLDPQGMTKIGDSSQGRGDAASPVDGILGKVGGSFTSQVHQDLFCSNEVSHRKVGLILSGMAQELSCS